MPALPTRILVIDSDKQIRRLLRVSMDSHGYSLLEAESGTEGLEVAKARPPDAFLLEIKLPDMSGLEVIRRLRQWTPAPILVISEKDDESSKVEALESGADDYVIKPFSTPELVARLRVALRHANGVHLTDGSPNIFESHGLKIDLENRVITVRGREVKLSPMEYRLLALLTKYAGKVISHHQILNEVWGPERIGDTHYLRVCIHHLRHKIESDPANPQHILTEGYIGYRLRRT